MAKKPADTQTGNVELIAKAPPDLTAPHLKKAIEIGKNVLAENGTKADAARAIFELISKEEKEVIVAAFVAGATLTEKGALTYWYNCRRKHNRMKSSSAE